MREHLWFEPGLMKNSLPQALAAAFLVFNISGPVLRAAEPENSGANTVALEALSRLKGIDLESNPAIKAAVMKVLASVKGTPQFVELVRDFEIKGQNPALVELAIQNSTNSTGVDATRLVIENNGLDLFKEPLKSSAPEVAIKAAEVLGNTGEKSVVPLLESVAADEKRNADIRKQAIHSLAQTQEGAEAVLQLARQNKLSEDLKTAAGKELAAVRWPNIKSEAAKLLPSTQPDAAPALPPISELMTKKGDAKRGAEVFARPTVGCINCHQINGQGVDFGPKLSEIGTKLGKDGLYAAILDPSAGISFGYEAWQIEFKNGDEAFGLIASETAEELAVKTSNGITTRYKKTDIAKREKKTTSIMPSGLEQTMSTQDLIDLVEYLSSLKTAAPPKH